MKEGKFLLITGSVTCHVTFVYDAFYLIIDYFRQTSKDALNNLEW